MPSTLRDRALTPPRKMLAMRGESLRKRLADPDIVRLLGRAIERALERADLTKQDAAHRMGYEDQSALSRWISGAETPQIARLWTLGEDFQRALVIELASACQVGVKVRTTIELEQSA
jgi:ribosome-binding protein aMBF1 (putative translation factor)